MLAGALVLFIHHCHGAKTKLADPGGKCEEAKAGVCNLFIPISIKSWVLLTARRFTLTPRGRECRFGGFPRSRDLLHGQEVEKK